MDQPFDLSSLLGGIGIPVSNWTIRLKLYEDTNDPNSNANPDNGANDDLWIDKSVVVVEGEYVTVVQGAPSPQGNPTPEPATMLLLGSGLVGLAGVAKKKMKK